MRQQKLNYESPAGHIASRPSWLRNMIANVVLGIMAIWFVGSVVEWTVSIKHESQRRARNELSFAQRQINDFLLGMNQFRANYGRFATTSEGLSALYEQPAGLSDWKGPFQTFTTSLENDPWGMPYIYIFPGQVNKDSFDVYSSGPDRQPQTADDIWPK